MLLLSGKVCFRPPVYIKEASLFYFLKVVLFYLPVAPH